MNDGIWAVFVKHPGEDWKRYSKVYSRIFFARKNIPYYAEWNPVDEVWITPGSHYIYKIMYSSFDWKDLDNE